MGRRIVGFGLAAATAAAAAPAFAQDAGAAPRAQPARAPGPAEAPKEHAGDIPFLPGSVRGLKEAEFTGKPIFYCFTASGWGACTRLAETSFKDPEVVRRAQAFVPVLADGRTEAVLRDRYGIEGFPTIVLADPAGRVVARIEGCVEPAALAAALEAAAARVGPPRPSPEARSLEAAGKALAKARERGEWREVLRAVAAIERIGHEGTILDAAREARKQAAAEARRRVDEAKKLLAAGKPDTARGILRRVAAEFKGLDEAHEARNLIKEMDAPPPDDDDDGGGGEKKEPRRKGGGGQRGGSGRH